VPRPDARRGPPQLERAGAMSHPEAGESVAALGVAALGRAPHYGLEQKAAKETKRDGGKAEG